MSVVLDVAAARGKLLPTFARQQTFVDEGGMSVARSRALASRPDVEVSHTAWLSGVDSVPATTPGEAAAGEAFIRSVKDAVGSLGPYRTTTAPRHAAPGAALLHVRTGTGGDAASYVVPLKDLEQRAPALLPAAARLEDTLRSTRPAGRHMWRDLVDEVRDALRPVPGS